MTTEEDQPGLTAAQLNGEEHYTKPDGRCWADCPACYAESLLHIDPPGNCPACHTTTEPRSK